MNRSDQYLSFPLSEASPGLAWAVYHWDREGGLPWQRRLGDPSSHPPFPVFGALPMPSIWDKISWEGEPGCVAPSRAPHALLVSRAQDGSPDP